MAVCLFHRGFIICVIICVRVHESIGLGDSVLNILDNADCVTTATVFSVLGREVTVGGKKIGPRVHCFRVILAEQIIWRCGSDGSCASTESESCSIGSVSAEDGFLWRMRVLRKNKNWGDEGYWARMVLFTRSYNARRCSRPV